MTFSPDPRKNPDAAPLVEKFRAKGVEPEGYVLYTYAAIQAWAAAAEAAGKTDFDPIVKALNDGTFKTVLGDLSFDDKGDGHPARLRVLRVEGRQVRLHEVIVHSA